MVFQGRGDRREAFFYETFTGGDTWEDPPHGDTL
jgi:hypothetical protein